MGATPWNSVLVNSIELFVKSLKDGWYQGFDPSLRKNSIKSSLVARSISKRWANTNAIEESD